MVEESERFEEEKISLMHSEELGFLGDPPIVIWTGTALWLCAFTSGCGVWKWTEESHVNFVALPPDIC